MLKTVFINLLKLAIAAGLIIWLANSGKLDFSLVAKLSQYPGALALAVVFSVINFWLISLRWRSILSARTTNHIPILGLLRITWIGQFFSSVLPGSMSGDLIKVLYVQKFDRQFSKKFIFASILIDRMMGLCGLILLVGASSLLFSSHILEDAPSMGKLLNTNYVLAILVILSLAIFVFFHDLIRKLLKQAEALFLPKLWQKIITLWDDLISIKSRMLKALLISLIVQFIGVVIFWVLISPFVEGHMDFKQALAFIPIGLMTLALPIAPSGLGVGHVIFDRLFALSSIDNGASLFNNYFVITLLVNLIGVIPYLLTKRHSHHSEN